MKSQIYVNLPVKDLSRSIMFFTGLGFSFNPKFTDENAICMIVCENIFVMLLTEKFYKTFTKKELCDSSKYNEVIVCLSAESRKKVDEMIRKAADAGGKIPMSKWDQGWMYGQGFQDIDGHLWEIMWMDENLMPDQTDM